MQDKKDHRGSLCDQNNDVSELHGFEVQGDSIDIENEEITYKQNERLKLMAVLRTIEVIVKNLSERTSTKIH